MKIALISDLHLGKRQYRTENNRINKYEKEGVRVYNEMIDSIINNNPDLVINCGDTFDVPDPSIYAIEAYTAGLKRLNDENISYCCVLGNHDFSFRNKLNDCSALQIAHTHCTSILKTAEYDIEHFSYKGEEFILVPYVYASEEDLKAYFSKLEKTVARYDKPIIVTHGIEEKYRDMFPMLTDSFIIPSSITKNCKAVFIGHIHDYFDYNVNNALVVSPGASINYQANELTTGVTYYDTETGKLIREMIDSPYIIKLNCNEENINTELDKVGKYIYQITYDGNTEAIDNDTFIKAKRQAINLKLLLKSDEIEEEQTVHNTNFLNWVDDNYPTKLSQIAEVWNTL